MGLREQIKAGTAEHLARTEDVTLPMCGVTVRVRGLTLGDFRRVQGLEGMKSIGTEMALCVLDPETGQPVWNANDQADHDEIAGMHLKDANAILEVSHRLSGIGKDAEKQRGKDSEDARSSDSSSPSDTGSPPVSLTAA